MANGRKRVFAAGCLVGLLVPVLGVGAFVFAQATLFRGAYVQQLGTQLKPPALTLGQKLPTDWTITSLDGEAYDWGRTKGQAVFLHFFSPDCLHCEAELPALARLQSAMAAGGGIEFLFVALDSREKVPELMARSGFPGPVYVLEGKRPAILDSATAPLTFLVAGNGDISLRVDGSAKWDEPASVAVLAFLSSVQPRE